MTEKSCKEIESYLNNIFTTGFYFLKSCKKLIGVDFRVVKVIKCLI